MKKHGSTILLILVFLTGMSLLLYPTLSNYWNSLHQSRAIGSYLEEVSTMEEDRYQEIWQAAGAYNQKLQERENTFFLTQELKQQYDTLLNISDTGIMGYIEIPSIEVSLPVYHGVDPSVLQIAVGHLDWTSLPVGGPGTHCVLSGHRGLPSSMLFTHLDRVVEGDVFLLRVLDEVLTYQVDQIRIVKPDQVQDLMVQEGKDLCTLVTCTPYGINSHRLLVRGHRIETVDEQTALVTADALQIDPVFVAPVVAVPILLVLLIMLLVPRKKP